jgi:hypothetical protein
MKHFYLLSRALSSRCASGICAIVMLAGCMGGPAPQTGFAPAQMSSQLQPTLLLYFEIRPGKSTIHLNGSKLLHALVKGCSRGCGSWWPDPSTWSSIGGELKVKNGGSEARFSADAPGVYNVYATSKKYQQRAHAIVNVTSP